MFRASITHTLRKSELLGISITEVLFVLIFVLLIFTHFSDKEKKNEINLKDKEISFLNEKIATLGKQYADLIKTNRELDKELIKWKKNYSALIKMFEKYDAAAGTLTPAEVIAKLDALLFVAGYKDNGTQSVADEMSSLKLANEKLKEEVRVLKLKIKQLQELREKESGGGGQDQPRCVVSGYPGIIDYLLQITINENDYNVRPLWEEKYDPVFSKIPGLKLGRDNNVSKADFIKSIDKTYRWGNTQDPKCRFYVEIFNNLNLRDIKGSVFLERFDPIGNRFYILKQGSGWK